MEIIFKALIRERETALVALVALALLAFFLILPYITRAMGQEITSEHLFPNATTPIPGNQSFVPGMHAMSLVNGVEATWLIISSDKELSVNLRYTANWTSPALSLFATALKASTPMPGVQQEPLPSLRNFQRFTGSNETSAGWISPTTVSIRLQGNTSLYDADIVVVMIIPNTAPGTNSTIPNSTNRTQPVL